MKSGFTLMARYDTHTPRTIASVCDDDPYQAIPMALIEPIAVFESSMDEVSEHSSAFCSGVGLCAAASLIIPVSCQGSCSLLIFVRYQYC